MSDPAVKPPPVCAVAVICFDRLEAMPKPDCLPAEQVMLMFEFELVKTGGTLNILKMKILQKTSWFLSCRSWRLPSRVRILSKCEKNADRQGRCP